MLGSPTEGSALMFRLSGTVLFVAQSNCSPEKEFLDVCHAEGELITFLKFFFDPKRSCFCSRGLS